MIKWIYLTFMFLSVNGALFYPTRNCPPINNWPHHTGSNKYAADSRKKDVVVNLGSIPNNLTAAIANDLNKWPQGKEFDGKYEIPYKFHKDVPLETKEAVYFGMVVVERGTNIIFIKKRQNDTDYVFFKQPKNKRICISNVGNEKGKQLIKLSPHCKHPTHLIHELLHAIGLDHEHQRPDRSVSNGTWGRKINEGPDPTINGLTPYDPFSIMHYALPVGSTLRAEDNWTETDTLLASFSRAFPSVCDYNGLNNIYQGHVQPPPCTNVRIHPALLEATAEGKRRWTEHFPMDESPGSQMTWACNSLSGGLFGGVEVVKYARKDRTLCEFPYGNMYPSIGWVPYAERVTYPLPGLNYSQFKTSPDEVHPNWITHDICDCLGPPPSFPSSFADHSMYQTCLECVHFKDTTADVLKCMAKRGGQYRTVLSYLQDSYNTTQYYLINPNSSRPVV